MSSMKLKIYEFIENNKLLYYFYSKTKTYHYIYHSKHVLIFFRFVILELGWKCLISYEKSKTSLKIRFLGFDINFYK
jgi:hypothetical protein